MNTEPRLTDARTPRSWPVGLAYRSWKMWAVRVLVLVILFGCAVLLGRVMATGTRSDAGGSHPAGAAQIWTCSMHPQIQLPSPGQCPICFMDLIPVQAGSDGELPELALNERARILARVETTPVERREVTHTLRMIGKIAPDETRITYVSSYIPGRIDRLFVNYTGIYVRPGDHLAEIYSPGLLVGQREYLVALEKADTSRQSPEGGAARQTSASLIESARRKLELWGVPEDEIERLQRERTPTDHIRIDAPLGGWVVERMAFEGMYIETGMRLFTLADLSTLWVMLDAYELDLPLLRYGQSVEFEAEAIPGRKFSGQISYIDPQLKDRTRTVNVRVNVANPEQLLRPGMFVRAEVQVQFGEDGAVAAPTYAGKWICPMHPEIVRDAQTGCDVCSMDLVPAETLPFVASGAAPGKVLAIPRTAVLFTGKRALVYVENRDDAGEVRYTGRDVELGPRAGDWYLVRQGLSEGERVVTHGAFQIDASLQIQAKPSMMQPAKETPAKAPPAGAEPETSTPPRAVAGAGYHATMRPVLAALIALTEALSADNAGAAGEAVSSLRAALGRAAPEGLSEEDGEIFRVQVDAIRAALPSEGVTDIEKIRSGLPPINSAVQAYLRTFGHDDTQPFVRMFCPMAFNDRGAYWLQRDNQVRNPYFGAKMFRCGEQRGAIATDGGEAR